MEAIKTNAEALQEGAKAAETLFHTTNAAMVDMFRKQKDLTIGFYSKLLNSFTDNNGGPRQSIGFPNMLINDDMSKWFTNPFGDFLSNNSQNAWFSEFDKSMKKFNDFNQTMLSAMGMGAQGKNSNWTKMNGEHKEKLTSQMEDSRKLLNSLNEVLSKQLNSSIETNKKNLEDLNTQVNAVVSQSIKFWTDALKIIQTPVNSDEEKSKEQNLSETKKRSNAQMML